MTIPARACLPLAVLGALGWVALIAVAPTGVHDAEETGSWLAFLVPLYATGVFAWRKRPDLPIARLLLAFAGLAAVDAGLSSLLQAIYESEGALQGLWPVATLGRVITMTGLIVAAAVVALFPDGVYSRPYERWVVRAFWIVPLAVLLQLLTSPTVGVLTDATETVPNPAQIEALAGLNEAVGTVVDLNGIPFVAGIVLLVLRYRRFGEEQRLQIRWILFVAITGVVAAETLWLLSDLADAPALETAGIVVASVFIALLPVAVLVAILRYRLLEVDLLVRRSLVYAVLWLLIVAAYVGAAAALGIAASGRLPVSVAILITILATLAFQPARRRLERLADRWVFGERLGGYELLTRFGATLEETFDPDELFARLAETVRRGLRVRWARVLVRRPAGNAYVLDPQAAAGIEPDAGVDATAAVPLEHAGEPLGLIEVGPKEAGDLGDEDRALLETLARQAAIAIRNARLASELSVRLEEIRDQAEELRASRARIVHAQDAERRRIERNIHDGAQQELVALIAKLRLARNQLARGPEQVDATLAELQEETAHVLEDLRELARGIHPSVLSDRGLVDAIEARAARMPVAVSVRADRAARAARFADDVEGAAYFVVSEALANALKHACAARVEVEISYEEGRLALEISDDGAGFEPAGARGSGLANMSDRVEALGGRLMIHGRPGQGARIAARLPARPRELANA